MNLSGALLTLVNQVRSRLNDETPSEQRWSDVDIVAAINTGEREVTRRTYDIEDSTTAEICTHTIVTDTATYSISNKVLFIKRMECSYDGLPLEKRTRAWLDENRSSWKVDEGLPTDFIEGKTSFTVTPIPTSTYNGYFFYLVVVRLPLVDLSETNATPEVHAKYYDDIVTYACYELKLKRDADTFDPDGAWVLYRKFEASVGPRPDGAVEKVIKEEPSGLRIQVRR